jgi:GNAT superfamily N-acetyltransferase
MSSQSHSGAPVQINPAWLDRAQYVEFLNQAFPGQWNGPAYDWYMGRAFNAQRSDTLVRADGDRVLSGMTLCYRQIAVGGDRLEIAILSAGATLAAERGRGHYPALLQTALQRCREKGCVAALGFVTRDNVSGQGLFRLGARAIPSFYLISPKSPRPAHPSTARQLEPTCPGAPDRRSALLAAFESLARRSASPSDAPGVPRAHFYYERADDWRQQFLQRPHTVRIVRLAHDSYAAIEAVHETDRLQLLVCPDHRRAGNIAALAAASAAAGRKFFMYTLVPAEAAAARRARLRIRAGYLMLQPTGVEADDWDRLAGAVWQVQSGDRM